MMGDNRDNSLDSRFDVGFVPLENFIGPARTIFFSVSNGSHPLAVWRWPSDMRADRIVQGPVTMYTTSKTRGSKRFGNLEARLGYEFSEYENLERALTHASVRKKSDNSFHYQRLEFLGDRVLGLAVAELLFEKYPDANEGELVPAAECAGKG